MKNEMAVLITMIKQQRMLPISVEQARAQVLRLKEQSQSAVKKGQRSGEQIRPLEERALKEFALQHQLWMPQAEFVRRFKNRYIGCLLYTSPSPRDS